MDLLKILLAIIIEVLAYNSIPLIVRLTAKKPINSSIVLLIATFNYTIVFSFTRLMLSHLFDSNLLGINTYLLSLLSIPLNIIILRFDPSNPKFLVKIIISIILIALFVTTIYVHFKILNNKNNTSDNTKTYDIVEIESATELKKVMNSDKPSAVLYLSEDCIYCENAFTVIKRMTKGYHIENMYYYKKPNDTITKYPTIIVYEDGKILDSLEGYSEKAEINESFYRLEVWKLLQNTNVTD